jgi:hypothetical protein
MAGYSQTPLAKKLGIKPGFNMMTINAPDYYYALFADLPEDLIVDNGNKEKKDLIHLFTTEQKELVKLLPQSKKQIVPNGIIWVSWPKKAAKVVTDVTENSIRDIALANGLVDVKVCAVDETWSGLKLVIPLKDRQNS